MHLSPGSKLTEVGVIPDDWEVYPVGQMGDVLTGKALAARAPGEPRPYLRTKNVFDGRIVIDDVLTMPMTNEQFARFRLRSGDVLLNEGQSLELVGRCSLYSDEYPEPCAMQNQLLRFRARAGVSGAFASYLFRRCQQTGVFAKIALQTTSIAHLGGSRFERLLLAWPREESEQRAIAAALSDVDALLGGLDQLIAKKLDLKHAVMRQLLTGQIRLLGFQGTWEILPAREIGVFRGGNGFPLGAQGETVGEHPFFKVSDMNTEGNETFMTSANHYISERTRKRLGTTLFPAGSIVFAKVGAAVFLERKKVLGQASCIDNNMAAFTLDTSRVDVGYVHALLLCAKLSALVATTALPAINGRQLGAMTLPIPTLPEQSAIAAVVSDIDAELTALGARRDKTRALKQAMMQELLTGRTRLIQTATPDA